MNTNHNNQMETLTKEISNPNIRLGFSTMETVELVNALNMLLCNYQVHYQKLRNYHWNIEGPDFFELHEQFEIEYDLVKARIDEIAERIRVFGKFPISTMQEYLEHSTIKETTQPMSSYEMVQEIKADLIILVSLMIDVVNAAQRSGDSATIDMVNGYMKETEQRHWMYTAWSKK
jgi:starvation-inducible DNA-binding protein